MKIILASSSPRRTELLRQLGLSFEVRNPNIDESPRPGEAPAGLARRLALDKARVVASNRTGELVLGADTLVELNGVVLGKPDGYREALRMLSGLSGREHRVLSAVAVVCDGWEKVLLNTTRVWFRSLSRAEIRGYWDTGEPVGKAGAYAIQGLGALFINTIEGSYSAVMGLPLYETGLLLREAGLPILGNPAPP